MIRATFATTFTLGIALGLAGCNSAPAPVPPTKEPVKPVVTYPARPSVAPAAFTVLHFNPDTSTFTLIAKEDATDDELIATVWQLRDAARSGSLETLKIKTPAGNDLRTSIYRGKKCATEKYAPGAPPCGGSYHGAADYTMSKLPGKVWDKGLLHRADGKDIELWDTDAPYTATK